MAVMGEGVEAIKTGSLQKETRLWTVNIQWNMQILYYKIIHLKFI